MNSTWVNGQKVEPTDRQKEVLGFLDKFIQHGVSHDKAHGVDVLYDQFMNGYCLHFALMLQGLFQRGKVCLAAPFGHMVWMDDDGTCYDYGGFYDGEAYYFIPIDMIPKSMLTDFRHVPSEVPTAYISKTRCIWLMKRYCDLAGIDYDAEAERYLKPSAVR